MLATAPSAWTLSAIFGRAPRLDRVNSFSATFSGSQWTRYSATRRFPPCESCGPPRPISVVRASILASAATARYVDCTPANPVRIVRGVNRMPSRRYYLSGADLSDQFGSNHSEPGLGGNRETDCCYAATMQEYRGLPAVIVELCSRRSDIGQNVSGRSLAARGASSGFSASRAT